MILANWLVTVAFAVTAVLLAEETGQRGNARLFAGMAVFWTAGAFARMPHVGPFVTWFCAPLVFPFTATVLLRYPEPRLHHRIEKTFIAVVAGWLVGSLLLWGVVSKSAWFGYPADSWWPTLYPNPGASVVLLRNLALPLYRQSCGGAAGLPGSTVAAGSASPMAID